MDYKADIESKAKFYREGFLTAHSEFKQLRERIYTLGKSRDDYFEKTLEAMCNGLSKRDSSPQTLTKDEREVIHLVESGQLQDILSRMPEFDRVEYEKKKMRSYQQAKKRTPEGELVVCSYLDQRAEIGERRTLLLTLPVKVSRKHSEGSLEEALYEHNVNIIDIGMKRIVSNNEVADRLGYVRFEIGISKDQVSETIQQLTSKLERDLPPALTKANVKYSLAIVQDDLRGFPEVSEAETSLNILELMVSTLEEHRKKTPLEPRPEAQSMKVREKQYYTTIQATDLWHHDHEESGISLSKKEIYWSIYAKIRSKAKKEFDAIKKDDKKRGYLIEKESFDLFRRTHRIDPKTGKLIEGELQRPSPMRETTTHEIREMWYTTAEASRLWQQEMKRIGLSIPYKNTYSFIANTLRGAARQKAFHGTQKGKKRLVEKSSFDQYIRENIVKPIEDGNGGYAIVPRPNTILDLMESELSLATAARYLDVSCPTIQRFIEKKEFSQSREGYISGDSMKQFFRKKLRQGGPEKTYWVDWEGKSKDPNYVPVMHEMSYHDAAEFLDIAHITVARMIGRGELESTQQGFVTRKSVEALIKNKKKGGGKHKTRYLD